MLLDGKLDDREVEIEVTPQRYPNPDAMRPPEGMEGPDFSFTDWLLDALPKKKKLPPGQGAAGTTDPGR